MKKVRCRTGSPHPERKAPHGPSGRRGEASGTVPDPERRTGRKGVPGPLLPSAHRRTFGVLRRMFNRAFRETRRSELIGGRMLRRGAPGEAAPQVRTGPGDAPGAPQGAAGGRRGPTDGREPATALRAWIGPFRGSGQAERPRFRPQERRTGPSGRFRGPSPGEAASGALRASGWGPGARAAIRSRALPAARSRPCRPAPAIQTSAWSRRPRPWSRPRCPLPWAGASTCRSSQIAANLVRHVYTFGAGRRMVFLCADGKTLAPLGFPARVAALRLRSRAVARADGPQLDERGRFGGGPGPVSARIGRSEGRTGNDGRPAIRVNQLDPARGLPCAGRVPDRSCGPVRCSELPGRLRPPLLSPIPGSAIPALASSRDRTGRTARPIRRGLDARRPAPEHPPADRRCRRISTQARLTIRRLRSECFPVF